MDFDIPVDHVVEKKNNQKKKKIDKYLDLVREIKKLGNMMKTLIAIVVRAFGTAFKSL